MDILDSSTDGLHCPDSSFQISVATARQPAEPEYDCESSEEEEESYEGVGMRVVFKASLFQAARHQIHSARAMRPSNTSERSNAIEPARSLFSGGFCRHCELPKTYPIGSAYSRTTRSARMHSTCTASKYPFPERNNGSLRHFGCSTAPNLGAVFEHAGPLSRRKWIVQFPLYMLQTVCRSSSTRLPTMPGASRRSHC